MTPNFAGYAETAQSLVRPTRRHVDTLLAFLTNFINSNALLGIAILALLASIRANSISKKSYNLSQKALADTQRIMLHEKRSETLEEIDSQNAKFGTLLAILGESLTFFRENLKNQEVESGHIKRIRKKVVSV